MSIRLSARHFLCLTATRPRSGRPSVRQFAKVPIVRNPEVAAMGWCSRSNGDAFKLEEVRGNLSLEERGGRLFGRAKGALSLEEAKGGPQFGRTKGALSLEEPRGPQLG